jgi:hypothetical protein
VEPRGEALPEPRPVGPAGAFVRALGRLVEIRVGRITHVADVERMHADVVGAMEGAAATGCVICCDCRGASPLTPDAADAWSRAMREVSPFVERGSVLVDAANTMFNLQVERVVRCAGIPSGQLFFDGDATFEWLQGVLTEPERSELRSFLANADA